MIMLPHAESAARFRPMPNIPTEPIGSIPRPPSLIQAIAANPEDPALEALYDAADSGHDRAVRGDRIPGDHGRRAAQIPQFLDLLRSRARQYGP